MQGISNVTPTSSLKSGFLTLAVVAAFALALAGCGRKAGLDPPPDASLAPTADATSQTNPNGTGKSGAAASQQNLFNSGNPADRTQYAPKLPPKRIVIDPILDD